MPGTLETNDGRLAVIPCMAFNPLPLASPHWLTKLPDKLTKLSDLYHALNLKWFWEQVAQKATMKQHKKLRIKISSSCNNLPFQKTKELQQKKSYCSYQIYIRWLLNFFLTSPSNHQLY
jgi:hypothetical protein